MVGLIANVSIPKKLASTLMSSISRRAFCGIGMGTVFAAVSQGYAEPATTQPAGLTLSLGNYGMKGHKVEQAISVIAGLGFDGIELSVMPEWDSSGANLSGERRSRVARLLTDQGLVLSSLMEDLTPSAVQTEHQATLERLKVAADLGHDLSPNEPPLIQTVLGGGSWSEKKELFRDRVGDWLRIAESSKNVLGIKPHRSGAMSQPAEAVWLINQLGNSPWLGLIFDFSHYAFRDLSIAETVETALPATIQIVAKDVAKKEDKLEFALPGEANTIDHGEILKRFYQGGFRKSVCCEVSSQVFRRPDYNAESAAKTCYRHLDAVFEKSQIPRRRSK
jgi:sugar phosphate isomerase/epimerase